MNDALKIGIIGLGMGRSHWRAAIETPGVEVNAVADPSSERVKLGFETVGAEAQVFEDYKKMIEKADIDAVAIALPTDMHAESSIFALENGKHVLCEKPPTTSAEEMRTVAESAAASGLVYMFARQPRFNRATLRARELVLNGELGRVYHGETKWVRARNIPLRGGWGVNKDAGGGVLLDLGIHALDTGWFVMGCPRPESVNAVMHCAFSRFATPDLTMPYNADDSTFALVRFENGASLNLSVTFALNTGYPGRPGVNGGSGGKAGVEKSAEPFPEWQECHMYGDKKGLDVNGCRIIDNSGDEISIVEFDPWTGFDGDRDAYSAMGAQVAEFSRAIRANDEPMNTAIQAVQLMEMLDAIRKSAETGESVRLAEATQLYRRKI